MGEAKRKAEAAAQVRQSRGARRAIFERARKATVAVAILGTDGMTIIGSGVVVHRSGLILTARHVIDQVEKMALERRKTDPSVAAQVLVSAPAVYTVATEGGQETHTITIDYTSHNLVRKTTHASHDIAMLQVQIDPNHPLETLPVSFETEIWEGDEVATCGFPYGVELHEGATVISSFLLGTVSAVVPHPAMPVAYRHHYMLQLPVNPGNSGGPVFDPDTGHVLGVVSRRYEPRGIPAGLCVAEPVHHMKQHIEQIRLGGAFA